MPMVDHDSLPEDVHIRCLQPHADERGVLTEIFREEWAVGCDAVQWNLVHSAARVLRGVHVHTEHHDYVVVVGGVLVLGLHDMRPHSHSRGRSWVVTLDAATPTAVVIPPGVCHGFYFPVPSTHVYAVSHYWNPHDELGCRFDCDELGIDWPNGSPILSARDRDAGSYAELCRAFQDRQLASAPAAAS